METPTVLLLLALGGALVVVSILLRVFSDGKWEIKTIDLVFLVIPLLLVALATGKLKGVDLFGVKADFSELWAKAADSQIEDQVASTERLSVQDAVRMLEMGAKGGPQQLQVLIERRIQALEFRLGHGGYFGPAIKAYLDALSGSSYLRVVVINRPDGRLFGVFNAADLIAYLRVSGDDGYQQFQQMLNSSEEARWRELTRLPGFLGAEVAVDNSFSKRDALARMEQLGSDSLPVVDEARKFVGTVARAELTASLILAVTRKSEGK